MPDKKDEYEISSNVDIDFNRTKEFLDTELKERWREYDLVNNEHPVRVGTDTQTQSGFSGEETIEFDLMMSKSGKVIKANYRKTSAPDKGKSGGGEEWGIDLDQCKDEEEQREALDNLHELMAQHYLKQGNLPGNSPLNLYCEPQGNGQYDDVIKQSMMEVFSKHAKEFQDKGIEVNLEMCGEKMNLVPLKPDQDYKPSSRTPQVPKGAPKLTRDNKSGG